MTGIIAGPLLPRRPGHPAPADAISAEPRFRLYGLARPRSLTRPLEQSLHPSDLSTSHRAHLACAELAVSVPLKLKDETKRSSHFGFEDAPADSL